MIYVQSTITVMLGRVFQRRRRSSGLLVDAAWAILMFLQAAEPSELSSCVEVQVAVLGSRP